MTRAPYGPDELDRVEPELDRVAEALEQFAADESETPPIGLAHRIVAAVDDEPEPVPGWWARLGASLVPWRGVARGLAAAAVVVAAIAGGLAVAELADRDAGPYVGTSPSPAVVVSPSPSPWPSPSASPSASPSPSPSPSRTVAPSASESDDAAVETAEPSGSDGS